MKLKLTNPTVFRPVAKAEALVAELTADPDEDWTYTVGPVNKAGQAAIFITDEDGREVGTL